MIDLQLRRGTSREREQLSSGFTIVELLIVIIVIAILALIVITTYNGVQAKARNVKTVAAVQEWTKALNLYHLDKGSWPGFSCLGDTTTYGGDGHCWNAGAWSVVSPSFQSAMQPYVGSSVPEPDVTDINPSNGPMRGAFFFLSVNLEPKLYFMQSGVSSCPSVGGLAYNGKQVVSGGVVCMEQITQ